MKQFPRLLFLISLLFAQPGFAAEIPIKPAPELAALFDAQKLTGTFALLDPKANVRHIYNPDRAATRFIPASTFKIPNTLIGLTTGAVKNVDEILPYGGKPQWLPAWEKDLSLRDAIVVSSVPIYQELARRIGPERMTDALQKLNYGNQKIGTIVDRFWLDGPLEISAIEQTDFLAKLAAKSLPFPADAMKFTQEILLLEQSPTSNLYGKTGWTGADAHIGWFVGWVEKSGEIFPFALNIEMTEMAQAPKRIVLAKECLKQLGVLE